MDCKFCPQKAVLNNNHFVQRCEMHESIAEKYEIEFFAEFPNFSKWKSQKKEIDSFDSNFLKINTRLLKKK